MHNADVASTAVDLPPEEIDRIVNEVTTAFESYESALLANDVATLNDSFWDTPFTVRADASGVLVGWDSIAQFRATNQAPNRTVKDVHVAVLTATTVVIVASTRRADGRPGLQTQAWVKTASGWKIGAAHVSAHGAVQSAAAPGKSMTGDTRVDRAIWRVVGDPLLAGAVAGPLHGLDVAVKDLFAVSGFPVGLGNPSWLAEAPVETRNADTVQLLLDAGANVAGISRTDEFAYSLSGTNVHYGTPPNPASEAGVPGGSSSGSASAVAMKLVDIGLGTDTAGSIRVPASYCGLYGFRPTHGDISSEGLVPLAPTFDTVGWMARDAETLARVADVLLPQKAAPPIQSLLIADDLVDLADAPVQNMVREAAEELAQRVGLPLQRSQDLCGGRIDDWVAAFRTVQAAEAWATHGAWLSRHPHTVEPEIEQRFHEGRAVASDQLAAAKETIDQARRWLHEKLPPGVAVLQPAASTPPPPPTINGEPKALMRAGTLRLTCPASVAGLPVVTLPGGVLPTGPIGLSIVGSRHSDLQLIALLK